MSGSAPYLRGPLTRIGLAAALGALVIDQASKLWLIFVYGLPAKGRVPVAPFLDFAMTWNRGISYGWFQQEGPWLLLGVKIVAVSLLWVWLARAETRLTALALGLIIGGALGNALDRILYGAVADFVLFYIQTPAWSFHWYVFNLADVAIVAGVAGLLYESVVGDRAAKAPRSGA